jgi:hypothetical protein
MVALISGWDARPADTRAFGPRSQGGTVDSPLVKEQLGRALIQLTVDTCGSLIPGANRQAVDRLDDTTIRNPEATDKEKGAAA